jgi:UDP-3-O-[3-hydroxymyristoyl] glucosamine N-acyltransferase
VVGSDGFGYIPDEKGEFIKVPQIGNVILEDNVELGSNVSIDRAAMGSTILRKGVKLDNLVQIAHNVEVGENTVMSAQVGIAGSTKIGRNCMFGGQAGVVGHSEIADFVMLGAQSGAKKSITKPGKYFGSPAIEFKDAFRREAHIKNIGSYVEKIKILEEKIAFLEMQNSQIRSKDN